MYMEKPEEQLLLHSKNLEISQVTVFHMNGADESRRAGYLKLKQEGLNPMAVDLEDDEVEAYG